PPPPTSPNKTTASAHHQQKQPPNSPQKTIQRYEALPPVDPELAALVCRQVILPLFEKKNGEPLDIAKHGVPNPNGVLHEVKLSEKLLKEVILSRDELRDLERYHADLKRETHWLESRTKERLLHEYRELKRKEETKVQDLNRKELQERWDLDAEKRKLENKETCLKQELNLFDAENE
ncbi:unnamed protein product, partial [Amoebophrya sp. A120]